MTSNNRAEAKCVSSHNYGKKSHSADASSDDDSYAGVEQISDSEEDEPGVEEEEERAIIFAEDSFNSLDNTMNILEETWEGFPDYPNTVDDMLLFGQENLSEEEWYLRAEVAENKEPNEYTTKKRAQSLQIESSEDEFDMFDDLFPDIFIDKDHLDASFRRQIDHDEVSDEGSYWEHDEVEPSYGISYADTYTVMGVVKNDEYNDCDSDSSSLTGYESDISGETTDDDLPAEYYSQHRKTNIQSPEPESDTEGDTQNRNAARTPRLYSWEHTSDKPFGTVSSNCKKMILFNLQDFRYFGSSKCSNQFPSTQYSNQNTSSPSAIITNNLMLSTMQDPSLTNFNSFATPGMPEFYAPLKIEPATELMTYGSSGYDTDDLQEDNGTDSTPDIDEFINFEPDDESSLKSREVDPSSECVDTETTNPTCTAKSNNEDQVHPLISHFNRGVVGSWRQKQNTHKLLHRNIVTPDSLAFGGNRFMEGTLKGVKTGRLRHANTPITPVRKQRPLKSLSLASDSIASFFEGKEKYDNYRGEARTFKRRKVKV